MAMFTNDECFLWFHNEMRLWAVPDLRLAVDMIQTKHREMIAARFPGVVFFCTDMPRQLEKLRDALPPRFDVGDALFRTRLAVLANVQAPYHQLLDLVHRDPFHAGLVLAAEGGSASAVGQTEGAAMDLLLKMASMAHRLFEASDFEVLRAHQSVRFPLSRESHGNRLGK